MYPRMQGPPRLTGYTRTFGRSSFDATKTAPDNFEERRRWNRQNQEQGFPQWNNLRETLVHILRKRKVQEKNIDSEVQLNIFKKEIINNVVGSESSSSVINDACIQIFKECLDEVQAHGVPTKHFFQTLRTVYGLTNQATAHRLFEVVKEIANSFEDDDFLSLKIKLQDNAATKRQESQPEFARRIEFRPVEPPSLSLARFDYLQDLNPAEPEFQLHNRLTFDLETVQERQESAKRSKTSPGHDVGWLESEVRRFYGDEQPLGMSLAEFTMTLIELLTSKRSSDDLQTELFDLIGFDKIELIQLVLEHREQIVKSYRQSKDVMKQEILSAAAARASALQLQQPQRPNYGCQIMVQSEEERQIRKQMRKEEKKLHRIMQRHEGDDLEDVDDEQVIELRSKHSTQMAVATSMTSLPLLKESRERYVPAHELYPNVFDSYSKAKMTSGFIRGVKMSLPAKFERIDNKKFEEVTIPASDPAPVEIGRKLIPIDSFDEIGQAAFRGMKSLNRIQSVVCDAAYRTNENLLVCAPTGAGKTNVAMLCIAQTIKQHIDKGVIKKDSFKIVYVAPMKALAAEMTANFGKRLAPLGLTVRELTGDMQLTKTEIQQTQMLVTTPEKWDVVTRKPGDVALAQLVRLLIIDEVHLLHGDRGPVIEALVARTLRLVESSQTVIRVVGLSATLPNYVDVAQFLRVNPYTGLFFFDGRFRPVPLAQTFVGVKETRAMQQQIEMNEICYDKVSDFVRKGHQVMVFVHARNATVKTAMVLKEAAQNKGQSQVFSPEESGELGQALKSLAKSRNKQLVELFHAGFGIHHAGMLRSDRNLVEKLFGQGLIKVLVCTATLAWGVNLPAHAVIIKGTEIYDAKRGTFVDVGILDVLQIFGRAGRPQFDTSGHGTIITGHDKLSHYLSLLTNQFPIESNFITLIADNLNAEIALGTVTNVDEAIEWLSYTYLFVRMRKNPLVYAVTYQELKDDPQLENKRRQIIVDAARRLDKAKMIRFDERTNYLFATDLGRTSSHFYIKYDTIEIFNEHLKPVMNEADILAMLSQASEFEQLKVRDEELSEMDELIHEYCEVPVKGGCENPHGKVNLLLQTHISRGRVSAFSLISDQMYVVTNASRIARALFEIVLRKNWPLLAGRILKFSKTIERQMWDFECPLKQHPNIKFEVLNKLEQRNFTIDKLRELEAKEIGLLIHHVRAGADVKKAAMEIPLVEMEATIQPITRTVLRVKLTVAPNFKWNDRVHGGTAEPFWIWVEDPENNHIYHHEYFLLSKKQVIKSEPQELVFTIPIFEPLPTQYYVRALSDRWIGSETYCTISFQHLILPERHPPHNNLLDLQPLPVTALDNPEFELLYKFTHFNPIQTQIFHTLYHTDKNVLLGAPTGSGKTIAAELAMFKVFRDYPGCKVVYIAPLKALVRERMEDWRVRLEGKLGKKVVELTGDVTPDMNAIKNSSVIVTTPEKWDGISRSWQTRNYVQAVALIVIDEIHLLGEDRGPVLEVIVSRTNFISSHTERNLRVIGLSTALANARDLADWLGIGQMGLYNFRPSVRPVPLEVHIAGFPGKHYCPRMATMNKPSFQAIQQHSPTKPSLIFVSSRRQTRLTALDLIAFLAGESNPKMWLHMDETEMDGICQTIKDQNLRLTLAFGIGMHHAGLVERDRKTVEELYVNQKIQVLIATATLAWGVNFPTHLVIIKGTEYYDGKLKRYVDMPITDVLQMMGRAGRPQYDDQGVACVLVHDVKKHFYKKFLYEPFPVESSLLQVLPDHLNAEVVAGTIQTKQDAMDYITWTYFFRRLIQNPTYYGLDGVDESNLNTFLTVIVEKALDTLEQSYCLEIDEDGRSIISTTLGRISSYYYLSHETILHFRDTLNPNMTAEDVLQALVDSTEYNQLPVRHNEDNMNTELAKDCPIEVNPYTMDSPHTKAHLLLQCHFGRIDLPCTDYYTDTKSVLDQAIRILQAMIDISAEYGWLATTLRIQQLLQMIIQARWHDDHSALTLPRLERHMMYLFKKAKIGSLPELMHHYSGKYESLASLLRPELDEPEIEDVFQSLSRLPNVAVEMSLQFGDGRTERVVQGGRSDRVWHKVGVDREYTLQVDLRRINRLPKDGKALTPKFPKPKDEGWFLVMGHVDAGELVALKRIGTVRGHSGQQLIFYTPERPGRAVYSLYLISDAYLGLDQQYEVCLDVIGELAEEVPDDFSDPEFEDSIESEQTINEPILQNLLESSKSDSFGARPKVPSEDLPSGEQPMEQRKRNRGRKSKGNQ